MTAAALRRKGAGAAGRLRRVLWGCAVPAMVLAACRAPVHRLDFVLPASGDAEVLVLGERLELEFENEGPGGVELKIEVSNADAPETVTLGRARWIASMRGPVRISCRNTEDLVARLRVRADGADGIALDQRPDGAGSSGD